MKIGKIGNKNLIIDIVVPLTKGTIILRIEKRLNDKLNDGLNNK